MEAVTYSVLVIGPIGKVTTWREAARVESPTQPLGLRETAIEHARKMLDEGRARAASVQGHGTPEHPTPVGEVVVYRGVAAGFSPSIFGDVTADVTAVERRATRPRKKRRARRPYGAEYGQ
jgi:hypothetical protein